ncbi:related to threonine aldolase [Phialocephala subalpina]|uniref:Related to threonine aldolase n=1 Tax=Phialocephala subalpina TaxID=576137 RepID=A0A1L7X0D4_9HELO|nr:related to threonine aldolase [Phialocephala subalpina]
MGSIENMSDLAIDSSVTATKGETSNAWSTPGPSAFDFRSDTITTPNATMLQAIQNTTLFDDGYGEDPTTIALEANMAKLCGHEAGLFLLSGTMGNQVAIRSLLTQPPHAILCDQRAHIRYLEAGGIAMLCGAMVNGVMPSNGAYLRLEDIEEHAEVTNGENVNAYPTKVISLENTLRGIINPLDNIKKISEFAKKNGIKMHLDGARLWEVAAAGAGSLEEYGKCFDSVTLCFSKGLGAPMGSILISEFAKKNGIKMHLDGARLWEVAAAGAGSLEEYGKCFDSVTLCFSKGLGAPMGSILVGNHEFIKRAKWIRQAIGGEGEWWCTTRLPTKRLRDLKGC